MAILADMENKPPTATIEAAHREHLNALPFDDTRDFADADRGFIAKQDPCVITAADGRVVWDNDVYAFLTGDAPTSVHPSLWRQSTLVAKQGLYEVVPAIVPTRPSVILQHHRSLAIIIKTRLDRTFKLERTRRLAFSSMASLRYMLKQCNNC